MKLESRSLFIHAKDVGVTSSRIFHWFIAAIVLVGIISYHTTTQSCTTLCEKLESIWITSSTNASKLTKFEILKTGVESALNSYII